MYKILKEVNSKISSNDLIEIDRVTSDEVITDAVRKNKNDPVFIFNSDYITQAPKSLYEHQII